MSAVSMHVQIWRLLNVQCQAMTFKTHRAQRKTFTTFGSKITNIKNKKHQRPQEKVGSEERKKVVDASSLSNNKTCSNTKNFQYQKALSCQVHKDHADLQRSLPDGFVSHNLASLVLTTKRAKTLPPKSRDDGYYPITVPTELKYMANM